MPKRESSNDYFHGSAKQQKALMPGITKEYAKPTGAGKIARKEQNEIGWKMALERTNENRN